MTRTGTPRALFRPHPAPTRGSGGDIAEVDAGGDGNAIEGDGTDKLDCNGANVADITMDSNDVATIHFVTRGGGDNIVVGDLAGPLDGSAGSSSGPGRFFRMRPRSLPASRPPAPNTAGDERGDFTSSRSGVRLVERRGTPLI
jgi:hypothetical protein